MSRRDARRQRRVRWAARLGPHLIRALARTWRVSAGNEESFLERRRSGQPVIFAFWHAHILPLLWRHRNQGVAVLISTHADGEIIARICEALGYRTIRGSTSRGGARALVELTRTLQQGTDVAVTPDGPRGPAESVAPGMLYAAARANVPIVPIQVAASRAWRLRTWDRFMIPKPFARLTITYGDRLVPSAVTEPDIEHAATEFRARMQALAAGS